MKNILSMVILTLTFSAKAYDYTLVDSVSLDSKNISLGSLGTKNSGEVLITRTSKTPKRVKLTYTEVAYNRECIDWDTERYWVEGRNVSTCSQRDSQGVCCGWSDSWQAGYYDTRSVCVDYEYVPYLAAMKVKLKFKKSTNLLSGQSETYKLTLKEASHSSLESVVTESTYKMKYSKLFKLWSIK